MIQYRYKFIVLLTLIFVCNIVYADDILFTISPYDLNKIPLSAIDKCTFRFQGKDILIAQSDESLAKQMPASVIAKISQDYSYYFVKYGKIRPLIESFAKVILDYNGSLLLSMNPEYVPELIAIGLPFFELPEYVKLDFTKKAPRYESSSEFDVAAIGDIIKMVNAENLKQFTLDLQENKNLDPPHTAYKSRYCLRVRNTDDKSDEAADNAADYIFNKFKGYGLDVEYDQFPHEVLTQGHYTMRNVVATLPGKDKYNHKIYIIAAHYDSVASKTNNWQLDWKKLPAPGADDNASGTSAVLEAARILSKFQFNSTIRFVTFSGEELGLHGSRYYAKKVYDEKEEIAGIINLDMIGYDPDTLDMDIITNLGSEWLAEAMLSIQKKYNISDLILNKIVNPDMVYSDHAPFWQNGFNAILGIDCSVFDSPDFNPFMHTPNDTIDKLNISMMASMCQIATATLASLADPIDELPHPDLSVTEKDIVLSTENPTFGQSVQLKATIYNIGDADANDIVIQVWIEEPLSRSPRLIAEKAVDVLTESKAEIDASFTISEWGDSRLIIKVNPDYRVFETDGRNNIITKTIHIGSSLPESGKLLIYPNPAKLANDSKICLEYTMSKDSPARLEIYTIDGKLIYEREFVSGDDGGKFGVNKDIKWNGIGMAGEKIAPGVYVCRIMTLDESSEKKSISKKFVILR